VPQLSEEDLIATIFAPLAGPGGLRLEDDAALLNIPEGEALVLTKDVLVAGVHFFADDPPHAIAKKALRVNLSDLAAKGAVPQGFLLGLVLPGDWREDWLKTFAAGLGDDAAHFAISLLGGDTVRTPGPLTVSITAVGTVPEGKMVPRGGIAESDLLYVSGTIGDAALGLRLFGAAPQDEPWHRLSQAERAHLRGRYLLPLPRLGLRQALRAHAHAAMDVSDGLAGDLAKMLRLTGMSAEIAVADVPLSEAAKAVLAEDPELIATILSGGDDYEILCAVAEAAAPAFEAAAAAAGVAVTRIGRASRGVAAPRFIGPFGPVELRSPSFRHF
jgi:thiamine-monophosphate kinase